ncbi:xyloglucan endotransglucosylase/hydrolase 2-like [Cynara cardunculus var. scolymus]|uniref:xyloglucan endotransglucosylase/hydrolase 2-like n=1 Tax=Cynara cardunculus var. scolymus TaxID=59895 RepID=UPI000D63086D|nr:xyloglucan endotransglucosylase/hydrolase 2-like [Cynara cardunculus var. scolymus]
MGQSSHSYPKACAVALTISYLIVAASAGSFYDDIDITFGGERAKILNGGQDLTLSLDQYSGSGFQSKHEYLFGRFDMQLKLVPGNSAGTVTTFYSQPMRVYASLWNADDWATQGGRVKADWTKAPFTASYRKFNANAKRVGPNSKSTSSESGNQAWSTQGLDAAGRNRIRWVQNKHMIYNYCNDRKRFPNGLPAECKNSRFL